MISAFKNAGAIILGCAAFVALIVVAILFIHGTAIVGEKALPFLIDATNIVTALCIVVFFPLSLFRFTRIVPTWGFLFSSFLFGIGVWILGFLVTYDLWGGLGVFFGMCFFGIGVVPLGIIAAALKGIWWMVGTLVYGLVLTIGSRGLALYLAKKCDRDRQQAAQRELERLDGVQVAKEFREIFEANHAQIENNRVRLMTIIEEVSARNGGNACIGWNDNGEVFVHPDLDLELARPGNEGLRELVVEIGHVARIRQKPAPTEGSPSA
jgi:hypothetical protein